MIGAAALATSLLLADLPDEVLERVGAVPADATAATILAQVREADGAYRFELGSVHVDTDKRWWASTPDGGTGRALHEFRRWPGDAILAIYAAGGGEVPPVAKATWRASPSVAEPSCLEGSIATREGEHPALWCVRSVEGAPTRLAGLLLPGDGGLGVEGLAASRAALLDVWSRLAVRPESWAAVPPLPAGTKVDLPAVGLSPRDGDERTDPWQTVAGPGFTLGLPPGLLARRTDAGLLPPRATEGSVLWVRGRFADRDGAAVAVGDAARSGYVALLEEVDAPWLSGERAPLGLPRGARVDGLALDEVVVEESGARAGRVERWRETGWPGSWIVFRLAFGAQQGVEIGLPVTGAWRSLALFWIPATFRPEGLPPAPPPIDAAERLGIRFERLRSAERVRSPLTEGWLVAPGLRVELPRGWYPVVSIRAADGFPVTIFDTFGDLAGVVHRLAADDAVAQVGGAEGDWRALGRPSFHRAAAVHARADGARLFVAREGHAFLFEPATQDPSTSSPEGWERLLTSVALSKAKKPR